MKIAVVLLVILAGAGPIFAASVGPCTMQGSTAIVPLYSPGGQMTYCISTYGSSDSWFLGTPSTYTASMDVLSGDDSVYLGYSGGGNGGWLSPYMDLGTLSPQLITDSPYNLTTGGWSAVGKGVDYTGGTNSAGSTIINPDQVQIAINSAVTGFTFTETFTITNLNVVTALSNFVLFDYFNFHPNGSVAPISSSTSLLPNGCVTTTGTPGSTFLANGTLCGGTPLNPVAPDRVNLGYASGVASPIWRNVPFVTGSSNPVFLGDTAAVLGWNLGNIAPGSSVQFTITKYLGDPVPEPGTFYLMAGAGLLAAVRLRRRR